MCFETTRTARAKRAKTDIICWKVLGKKYASPVEYYVYKKGIINPIVKIKKRCSAWDYSYTIEAGYHSFIENKCAQRLMDEKLKVYKFIIPAGTRYYKNKTEYVSETIMLVK